MNPDEPTGDPYVVSHQTLLRLGGGDAAAGRRILRTLIDIEAVREPINGPTPRPGNVRIATLADEESLVELLRLDVAENAAHVAPCDETSLYEFVQSATRDLHNRGAAKPTIGVIGPTGYVEGAIFLELHPWFWNQNHWFVEERLTAVRPDCRKSRHASDLIHFARWFVDQMSAESGIRIRLVANVLATIGVGPKQAMFGRMLNRVGAIYSYPDPRA